MTTMTNTPLVDVAPPTLDPRDVSRSIVQFSGLKKIEGGFLASVRFDETMPSWLALSPLHRRLKVAFAMAATEADSFVVEAIYVNMKKTTAKGGAQRPNLVELKILDTVDGPAVPELLIKMPLNDVVAIALVPMADDESPERRSSDERRSRAISRAAMLAADGDFHTYLMNYYPADTKALQRRYMDVWAAHDGAQIPYTQLTPQERTELTETADMCFKLLLGINSKTEFRTCSSDIVDRLYDISRDFENFRRPVRS